MRGGKGRVTVGDRADLAGEDVVLTHETGDKAVHRIVVDVARVGHLLQAALAHHAHAVGHG